MRNESMDHLRKMAAAVAEGNGSDEECRTLGKIVLELIPDCVFEALEDGVNGWVVMTEEVIGRHCYILGRTLPDGRFVHLPLQLVRNSTLEAAHIRNLEHMQEIDAAISRLESARKPDAS